MTRLPSSAELVAAAPKPREEPLLGEEPLDRALHLAVARTTGGVSPLAIMGAWHDWAAHLGASPMRRAALARLAVLEAGNAFAQAGGAPTASTVSHARPDPRFKSEGWSRWPFSAYAAGFQAMERWWTEATAPIPGVTAQHADVVAFGARQMLDLLAPTNMLATNPDALARAWATGGTSVWQGWLNAVEDAWRAAAGRPEEGREAYIVGRDVASTAGEIVARTPLAEIIQYLPTTKAVRPEPVVITPAWIMKYYILDLGPEESLVRYLVDQGFTVFMVSWKNPDASYRDFGFDEYCRLGARAAIDAACAITGSKTVHALGYCLGGTLLTMTAAAMARKGDDRIGTLTLLASQADFSEAGELRLFVNEAQVNLLEQMMWDRGYLLPEQMAGTFQLLRSNDLVWSRMVHHYLMGEPDRPSKLDAWSRDTTRLPYRMESENLRKLYLGDDLAEGRFEVEGAPVALRDLYAPMFVLATETDHVAPWRSVYKYMALCDAEITFLLTNRGHNAGVVAPPGVTDRHHRLRKETPGEPYLGPDEWFASTPPKAGSWWPELSRWLESRSGEKVAPPPMGAPGAGYTPLGPAPGTYVLEP